MDQSTILALATIAAVFLGPIGAVMVTRGIDSVVIARQRRMDVFRTLMRTRTIRLNPDHVGALNLVAIEFRRKPKVISALTDYLKQLNLPVPPTNQPNDLDRFLRERDSLLVKLLDAIARSLAIKIEQLEILEGGYSPQGWAEDEFQQRILRHQLIDLLNGNRPLVVAPSTQQQQVDSVYPPAPKT